MPNHFLAAGVYGCVYFPGYTCEGKAFKKNKKWVSKLTYQNEKTEAEIEVGKRLKKVAGSRDHFVLVERHCTVPYKALKEMKKGCDLVKKDKHYVLLYSAFVPSIELYQYLKTNLLFYRLFRCYYQICEKIAILIEHKIVHHDLHFANVLYAKETAQLYLIDFGLSMTVDRFHQRPYLESVFSRYYPEWGWYALEIHMLTYVLQYGTLTEHAVRQTIDLYLKKHVVFSLDAELQSQTRREAQDYFLPLVDWDTQDCIQHLLTFWSTWDYYEVSLRFLHIYLENKTEYPDYYRMLVSRIHANPEKRPRSVAIHTTLQSFDISRQVKQEFTLHKSLTTTAFKKIDGV